MTNPRAKQTSARVYRHGLKKMAPELLALVQAQALAGCVQSQTLLLNRIVQPLRSTIGGLESSIEGISFKEQTLGLIELALQDGADLNHTQAAAGSRYFCDRFFPGVLLEKSAKITRPLHWGFFIA